MKYTSTYDYYKEKNLHKNYKYKYRLTYVGSYIYQLTKGKYKVLFKCYSFKDMYDFLILNNIDFSEVHMPYMTLSEFLKYWVSFESYEKKQKQRL